MKVNELFEKTTSISGQSLSLKDVKNTKELAKKLQVSEKELRKYSDTELLAILKNVGYHDFADTSKVNQQELKKGIKVEREHTNSDLVARLIALDHLISEMPDYYTRLEKMEYEHSYK